MTTRSISTVWMGVGILFTVLLGFTGFAQETRGFKFNNLTVSPYVNVEYNYD